MLFGRTKKLIRSNKVHVPYCEEKKRIPILKNIHGKSDLGKI